MAMIKKVWFDGNMWRKIKEYAGYSNNYPTDLPYYTQMLGIDRNYCMTKMKWKRVKTLEDYIDKLWDICWELELDLGYAFAPKRFKTTEQMRLEWEQMRLEWDAKYGEGSFDDDLY